MKQLNAPISSIWRYYRDSREYGFIEDFIFMVTGTGYVDEDGDPHYPITVLNGVPLDSFGRPYDEYEKLTYMCFWNGLSGTLTRIDKEEV